jgi:hypothetical protein
MAFQWKWLRGEFDDLTEAKSFAAFRIDLDGDIITRLYDRIAEGERDTVNVVLYPLALAIAENWWTLLYEPRKSDESNSLTEVRHSLDSYMNGFVFPALTLWSGGDDAITFEHPSVRPQYTNLEFLPATSNITNLPRNDVEDDLFELVRAVIERTPEGAAGTNLRDAWNRVLDSLQDRDEREYCKAAGRLGINPYDPDAEDISGLAEGLSEQLFSSICEAARPAEVRIATDWARESTRNLNIFPNVEIAHFGTMPERDPRGKIWIHGYDAARVVRQNLRLEGLNPRRVIDSIFGPAVRADTPAVEGARPLALEAVVNRTNGAMRVAIPTTPARLRRSRLCRASYLAWKTDEGESSAVTTATTLDQQASRAFAAELLAPVELLKELAGQDGLTSEKIEAFAEENVCPEPTIIWQAHNHEIPLRGVSLPRSHMT